jgi:circadian clock protein KaiB
MSRAAIPALSNEAPNIALADHYVLRLYVTGMTSRSTRAVENVRRVCEEHLKGRYDLVVVDIYQQPELAKAEQIVAAPTLIKKLPMPVRRVIGDLSSTDKVLLGLDIQRAPIRGTDERENEVRTTES